MPESSDDVVERGASLRTWLRHNILQVLALLAVLSYALNRLAYGLFYGRMGVSPQDVGLKHDDIAGQLGGVVVLVAVLVVATYYILAMGFVLAYVLELALYLLRFLRRLSSVLVRVLKRGRPLLDLANRLEHWLDSRRMTAYEGYWRLGFSPGGFVVASVLGLAVVCGAFVNFSMKAFDHAEDGDRVDPFRGLSSVLISLRAYPASVVPLDERSPPAADCLLYLGASDGTLTLYDYRAKDTIRLASGSVRLHVHPSRKSCERQ